MDEQAEVFLRDEGVEIDADAAYLLIMSDAGVLLEDIGPLLSGIEAAYRRLLTLSVDPVVRRLLIERHQTQAPLHGVSRSINVRYDRFLISRDNEYQLSSQEKRGLAKLKQDLPGRREGQPGKYWEPERPYAPYRVELARSRIASPGFLELIGDPGTLALLFSFLGFLIRERRIERHHRDQQTLALRQERRETLQVLLEMGYSHEEIEAVASFLNDDLEKIIRELRESRIRLAPGENIDPSSDRRQIGLGG